MTRDECRLLLLELIENVPRDKTLVIAIDGRSASGKTTFAEEIAKITDVPVIHTDDFCRSRNEHGELDIAEFDGNFDLERFSKEVVEGIRSRTDFEIGKFDCQLGCIDEKELIPKSNCYLIEGAYSHNPNLGDYVTVKIFFNVQKDIQRQRILARDGKSALERFLSLWIPAEERYIKHYKILEKSDYIINN